MRVRTFFNGRRSYLVVVALVVVVQVGAAPAVAHRMDVAVRVVGGELHGAATFHGGRPVAGAAVEMRDPLGEVLARTVTGPDGRFVVALTRRVPLEVVVETADGHLARRSVPADALPAGLPTAAEAAAAAQSDAMDALADRLAGETARHLGPIQDQLAELERRIWIRDVLGGVGYILGLAGLAAYLLSRRPAGSPEGPHP